jgi:hypothetical protein
MCSHRGGPEAALQRNRWNPTLPYIPKPDTSKAYPVHRVHALKPRTLIFEPSTFMADRRSKLICKPSTFAADIRGKLISINIFDLKLFDTSG